MTTNRREFLRQGGALLAWGTSGSLVRGAYRMDKSSAATQFEQYQQARRKELWGILEDLPWKHQPKPERPHHWFLRPDLRRGRPGRRGQDPRDAHLSDLQKRPPGRPPEL